MSNSISVQACDTAGKGFITGEDVTAASRDLGQEQQQHLLGILGTEGEGGVDFQTFCHRVTGILGQGEDR